MALSPIRVAQQQLPNSLQIKLPTHANEMQSREWKRADLNMEGKMEFTLTVNPSLKWNLASNQQLHKQMSYNSMKI